MHQGFEDGPLRFQCPSEIEDIPFDHGNFENHLFFLSVENVVLDIEQVFMDMVEFGEAAFQKERKDLIEEIRRAFFHIKPLLAFAGGKFVEKIGQLVDFFLVSGDEMIVRQDYVQFSRIGRSGLGVEKGDMDREKQAIFILRRARPDRRGDEFLDSQRMDIEILLEV